MSGTRRSLASLYSLLADNTAGDISAQDVRDLAASVYGSGLEPNAQTVTTTNVTGAVGQLYVCTIAGLTANRDLTLPSGTVGDRIGVYIADGDASFALVIKGAASVTINGGTAATEWSRLFIAGETAIFFCVGTNSWIVERDGRKPQMGQIKRTTTQGSLSGDTIVQLNTSVIDIGNVVSTSNHRIIVRRDGNYACSGQLSTTEASTSTTQRIIINLAKNGSLNHRGGRFVNFVSGVAHYLTAEIYWVQPLVTSDFVQLMVNSNIGTTPTIDAQTNIEPFLHVEEIL